MLEEHVSYLLELQFTSPTSNEIVFHLQEICRSLLADYEDLLEV